MSHYKSNLRDIHFNLFELLGRQDILGAGPFENPEQGKHGDRSPSFPGGDDSPVRRLTHRGVRAFRGADLIVK